MKKLGRIFSSLISLTLFFFGVFVVTKVAIPLFDPKFNEIEKQKFVGMQSAIPMEFDSENKPFWWMVQPDNYLQFTNSSDEEIVGEINLVFSSNPCEGEGIVEIEYGLSQKIQIPITLMPKKEFPVIIKFLEMEKCKPIEEDVRNFGAKLLSWNLL